MNVAATIASVIIVVAAALAVWRALRPGEIGDRAVAVDVLASLVTCGLFVAAAGSGDSVLLDVALVIGLLGFLTSLVIARFVERRGS
jgi:multicomponent Na+:H+ antiporter subunit F